MKVRKDFFRYILFILFVGIGSNIVNKVDVFMISSSINLSSTGIFTIAYYIITIMEIPSRVFLQVVNPLLAQAWKDTDIHSIETIYKKSSLNQFLIGGLILLLIWANIDNIFDIMPNGHIYEAGKYVVLFLGLGKLFDMVTGVNWYIIANSSFYYYQIIFISYLTLVSVGLNAWLIPLYGINGAGIASLIALASYNFLLMLFLRFKIGIWPFNKKTLFACCLIGILFFINAIMPFILNPIVDAGIRSIILSALFIYALLYFNISDDLVGLFNKIVGQLKTSLNGK